MKRITILFLIVPLLTYAQMGGRGRMRLPLPPATKQPPSLTEVMLFQYLDLRSVQQNYVAQVKQISENTRNKSSVLKTQLATYERRFLELCQKPLPSPSEQQEMLNLLEKITDINREIFALQRKAMSDIETLNREREKQILTITGRWLKEARKNPEELLRFVHFVNQQKGLPLPPTGNE
ncbi:hypothetical protein [Thermospira aquatica]|uniref:Periplasmic heavy metal sensor n=1 Tax=Thermospira aquatica TaxID=2828656 RepID=A0AAX3BCV6_9SPIR|nr:hypothetical protein [Thermospira aquatica]URA10142.1 hypothetical protein KDW03_11780 [Thermospira aquatica]